jgi:hypothetical protein
MPFTTSHPAIVLPLKQIFPRYFSLTGLMAGAMSPDLLYFLLLDTTYRGISHSWLGLFTFCLPAGIIFSFVFHRLFKYHVIMNLPGPLDRFLSGLALKRFKIKGFRRRLILFYSVLLGALSHFFWDSFTHSQGEIARAIPFLLDYSTILGITRQNCTFVQHLSTVLGGFLVLIYMLKSPLLPKPFIGKSVISSDRKIRFWLIGIIVAILFAIFTVFIKSHYDGWDLIGNPPLIYMFRTFGLASWAGFFYYVCVYTLFFGPVGVNSNQIPGNTDKNNRR